MKKNHSISILDVFVDPLTYPQALKTIETFINKDKRGYICVSAVHLLMECHKSLQLKRGVNNATLVTPDGMPLVWILRKKGAQTERIYGPDLMRLVCKEASHKKWRIFLAGGRKGVATRLKKALTQTYPSIKIVGTHETPSLPLNPQENTALIRDINASRADIVFVGMGCPNQEQWMVANRPLIHAPMLIGVGAAFDFLSKTKKQAPIWMQNSGLEWLFRLLQEPKRLWKRYILMNIQFCYLMMKALVRPR
jgi:N-acetylglucosaminyldiphosphoundecaprenol N-acetyl-beta-D-mannosaminyltransferase